MRFDPSRCFDLTHAVASHGDVESLRLEVTVQLWDFGSEQFHGVKFRVDTGADVSVVSKALAVRLLWPVGPWPNQSAMQTASGGTLLIERASAVPYRFARLPAFTFRTDFAVADDLPSTFGLLAWRDVAFDFEIRTLHLPRLDPAQRQVMVPGTQQFCLRPDADRFPGRVAQPSF